jgi:transposase InsO family protein
VETIETVNLVSGSAEADQTLASGATFNVQSKSGTNKFHKTLRAECLDVHWFATLAQAKHLIEAWRVEYDESRPHRSCGERTSHEFAMQIAASRDLQP